MAQSLETLPRVFDELPEAHQEAQEQVTTDAEVLSRRKQTTKFPQVASKLVAEADSVRAPCAGGDQKRIEEAFTLPIRG